MATYMENSCSFGLKYVSWYKYLSVHLVFSHLGFWSGNLFFLIAPFPDRCLLVPFHYIDTLKQDLSGTHQETMSVKCVPPQIPLLYNKIGVSRGIPIFS